jgi:hypothetical protein
MLVGALKRGLERARSGGIRTSATVSPKHRRGLDMRALLAARATLRRPQLAL